jgi:hypothetical protein
VFEGTGGGLGYRFGDADGAAFWNYDSACSCGRCAAEDCAEVVGVFNAVEDDDEIAADYVVEFFVFFLCADRHNALVVGIATGISIEGFAGFKPDGNLALTAEVDDFLNLGAARTFGNQYAVEGSARNQCFFYGMNPYQYRHLY